MANLSKNHRPLSKRVRLKMVSIERIYKTKAYDKLEDYCDDDKGGDCDNCMIADKYDRQAVINLLIPLIRKEEKERLKPKHNNG